MRIPFDSLNLAAVVAEAQSLVGSRLDQVLQTDDLTVVLTFWTGAQHWLLVSAHPNAPRAYLLSRRPPGLKPLPTFGAELRKRLSDAKVAFVRQRGLDRVLEIGFEVEAGVFVFVAELMGKHSNLILVDAKGSVVAAAKWVGAAKSQRPILPGRPYSPPPFDPKPNLLDANAGSDPTEYEGYSPFLAKLVNAGLPLEEVQRLLRAGKTAAFYSHGHGAYPFSVAKLGLTEVPRSSISQALEQHFEALVEHDRFVQAKTSLQSQLSRVLLAREVAIHDVTEAIETAKNARAIQVKGELILAYQGSIQPAATALDAWDYDGTPVSIPLRPDLSALENAERYFSRAKRAKARASEMEIQFERLERDRHALVAALASLSSASTLAEVEDLKSLAADRKWLQKSGEAKAREDRPFAGHAVRELLSPSGWRVLYGDNATANDHLTSKVAKPADLWFHVRGAPSAHVVLCTNNQPAKVQRADLEFAAEVAVRHSPSKHSGFVSVDYTQKRYVRKPRGSAPGTAVYTHEKTLHVSTS